MLIPIYKFGKWSGRQADIFLEEGSGYYACVYGGGCKTHSTRFYRNIETLKDELHKRGFYMIKNFGGNK